MTRIHALLPACGAAAFLITGCAPHTPIALQRMTAPPCEAARRSMEHVEVDWFGPNDKDEKKDAKQRTRLSAWCESVGPAVVNAPARIDPPVDVSRDGLVVVTWNTHEGGGDLQRFLAWLRRRIADRAGGAPALVVLMQEAFRGGDEVPANVPLSVRPPRPIRPNRSDDGDVAAVAAQTGMWLTYVPSMRNGADEREDRGCAILSTLPLSEVAAIELPWASQRRVAVMATLTAREGTAPWRLRVVSVHLDNRPGRSRQAAALARWIAAYRSDTTPILIGGDLNTWLGPREEAVRAIDAAIPRVRECGDEPTSRLGRHLDYIFTTLPPGVRRGCEIAADAFGSDHRPTVLRLFGG